ncbi:MAG: hypothetical protein R3F56_18785 [Planctomycetota bacterium]
MRADGGNRLATTIAALLLALPVAAQAGARLGDIPALARARNERLRPKMEASLKPYLADLAMDYGLASNRAYLNRRLVEVAALGDSIVPLLLEKLQPAEGTSDELNTAANAARVLEKLGPSGFVQPLIDLARSENAIARAHAIPLLGASGHVEAARFLENSLTGLPKSHQAAAVRALAMLGRRDAGAKVAELLDTTSMSLRGACLAFLDQLGGPAHKKAVLAALRNESQDDLFPLYLAYLHHHVPEDADAAAVLLGLLDSGRLIPPRRTDVVRALATVAPKGHDATCAKLKATIASGELSALGRACATTMMSLGDKTGRKELFDGLDADVRKSPRVPIVLANRGQAQFEFENWNDAIRDFKEALRLARSSNAKREFSLWIARAYVHQGQARRAAAALREGSVNRIEIEDAASHDPAFKDALAENSDLKALMRDLGR